MRAFRLAPVVLVLVAVGAVLTTVVPTEPSKPVPPPATTTITARPTAALSSATPSPSPPPTPSPTQQPAPIVLNVERVTVAPTGPLRGDVVWTIRRAATALPGASTPGRFELTLIPIAGGPARVALTWELTASRGGPGFSPVVRRQLSPDGRRFAFVSEQSRLIVVDLETGTMRQFTDDHEHLDAQPVWSRDGRKLAFRRARGGLEGGVWSIDADGTGLRRIVIGDPRRAGGDDPVYDWTPNGDAICYWELLDKYWCVRVADASYYAEVQFVRDLVPVDWRMKSPSLVSAFSQRGAGTSLLVAHDPRGGQLRTLATGRAQDVEWSSPRWHPTDDEIAYIEIRPSSALRPSVGLFVAPLIGSARPLRTQGAPREPEWSPAGDEVLFLGGETTTSPVNVGIFAARRDGSALREVWMGGDPISLATRRY